MKIHLVSKNRELQDLCKEVLTDISANGWTLTSSPHAGIDAAADVHIWDFEPQESEIPQELSPAEARRHFFILHRKHLESFREAMRTPDVNILLKPVTRAAFRVFLGEAWRQWGRTSGCPRSSSELRAVCDEMLQFLLDANLRLQEYDQDRTNFLARAVHDLRAPLTAISGYCGLMLTEQLGSITPDQREVLERMQHSLKRLSRMASAMFQLSIAQRTETKWNFQRGDLSDCIEQALHEVGPFTDQKRIAVSVDMLPAAEPVCFEKSQLEQVLINLLDNACKFTPRNGSIEIRGYPFFWDRRNDRLHVDSPIDRRVAHSSQPNSFRMDIRDSGPGIPPGQLDRIFEEYATYSGGQDRSGAGLGLAICRMILQQHQGRIWAENGSPGAIFSFVLPYERDSSLRLTETNNSSQERTSYTGVI
jgi:signal transduction histidine kinase